MMCGERIRDVLHYTYGQGFALWWTGTFGGFWVLDQLSGLRDTLATNALLATMGVALPRLVRWGWRDER